MSPRPLDSDFLNAIAADEGVEFVHLIEINFSGGPARIHTGAVDLDWNGFSWQAVGGALELGAVEETMDGGAQGVELRLSGVDQTVLSLLLGESFRGRDVAVWRAHLDQTTGEVVGTPLLLFQGPQLEPYTVEEQRGRTGNTVRISTRFSSLLSLRNVRGIRSNVTSHSHYFPGDTFFQHTSSLANRKIYWGSSTPRSGTPGGGVGWGGGDDNNGAGDVLW
jgi:hypothetical protein